jgi:flavin reductase (DIM6/NTAB) family NADH-FMN oxidoreductase RutF
MAMSATAEQHEEEDSRRVFRDVMARFATGVTVVTTSLDGEIYGMTANAFMAGSLEPLLCVVSIRRAALMHDRLMTARHFGISFLGERQRHFAAHFAGRGIDRLAPEFEHRGRTPVLRRSLAAVTASVFDTAACGDHTLFVGAIESMTLGTDDPPLLFFGGRYAQLARSAALESITPPGFW